MNGLYIRRECNAMSVYEFELLRYFPVRYEINKV